MADAWVDAYAKDFINVEAAAREVKQSITETLQGGALNIHLVETRAKSLDSVREKIERKGYGNPARQFDDIIGARVLTLFEHSVPETVERLRAKFDVDDSRSGNKTQDLQMKQVGYRSHHLVVKVRRPNSTPVGNVLKRTYIEIQVKSILAHSWAEIEHSLRYKIGDGIPHALGRRFDALAGALELADREFSGIEAETVELVSAKSARYRNGDDLADPLSTVQLLALLAASRPSMVSLGPHNLVLPVEDAFRYAKVLTKCGFSTVGTVRERLAQNDVLGVLDRYVQLRGSGNLGESSAVIVIAAVVGLQDRKHFSSVSAFVADVHLAEAIFG
jgi:ppGpp synthetase/RelA/SpoT-type nucleotidyltranferase